MPQTVGQLKSLDQSQNFVTFTAAARGVIAAVCRRSGQQVVVLAWPAGAAYLPATCYVPSEFDVVVTYVEGCPVYADSRRLAMFVTRRIVLDAEACSAGQPHPPLRTRAVPLKQPGRTAPRFRFDAFAAKVNRDLMRELVPQYADRFTEKVVARYVRAAIDDLRGSVKPEALPELAARLAHHRLASVRQPAATARAN